MLNKYSAAWSRKRLSARLSSGNTLLGDRCDIFYNAYAACNYLVSSWPWVVVCLPRYPPISSWTSCGGRLNAHSASSTASKVCHG